MNDFEEGVQLVHAFVIARQSRGEIEAESIHMHVDHPIAQAVHDQLQGARMEQIEGVPGAREILVETRIFRREPVVSQVVDPAKTERRPEVISFAGVIVNHVQDHFDPGRVEVPHHRFELRDLAALRAAAGVLRFRREEADGVVAPVIRQVSIGQNLVVDICVHRQQLHRGDAQIGQILDRR